MSDALVQEIRVRTLGMPTVIKDLEKINTNLVKLNQTAAQANFGKALEPLTRSVGELNRTLVAQGRQTQTLYRGIEDQMRKLASETARAAKAQTDLSKKLADTGKAASQAGNNLNAMKTKVSDIGKNVRFNEYVKGMADFAAGVKLSDNRLKELLRTTQQIRELRRLMNEPGGEQAVAARWGTGFAGYLKGGWAGAHLAQTGALSQEVEQRTRMTSDLLRRQAAISNHLHSAWRGMAAAAGQIWLSWGNFLPMMATLAPTLAVIKSTSVNREFGWQMMQVGAAAEIGNQQVQELSRTLLEMGGGGFTQGPVQMADALRILAQAGLDTQQALAALPSVLNLAMVAGTSDADAATFAAGLRYPFGLFDQDSLQAGIDQTAKAAAVSQTSIEQMMQSMKQAAPAAAKFGLSVTDVSTALAALAQVNITGSAGGTAMKNLLTDLAGRTEKSRAALQALGISAYDAAGMVKPFSLIISELQEKFRTMTDRDKQRWMKAFLDERGMRAADVLLNLTTEQFRKLHAEIARGAENMGYTTIQAQRLGETAEGSFRKMKAAWETTFAVVGGESESPFKGLMEGLTHLANRPDVINGLTGISQAMLSVAKAGVTTLSVLSAAAPALHGAAAAATVLAAAYAGKLVLGSKLVASGLAAMTLAAKVATGQVTLLSVKATGLTAVMAALKASMLAHPVGWIVGAAAAATGLYVAFQSATGKVNEFGLAVRGIRKDLGAVSTELYDAFNKTGAGKTIDVALGIDTETGKHVDAAYQARLTGASQAAVLSLKHTAEAYRHNLSSIMSTTQSEIEKAHTHMKESIVATARHHIEQEILIRDRRNTLLTTQLQDLDKMLAGQQELSQQDRDLRMSFEREIYQNAIRLMDLRTQYAMEKLREIRAEAVATASLWDRVFNPNVRRDEGVEQRLRDYNRAREEGRNLTADQHRLLGESLRLQQEGKSQEEANRQAAMMVYGASMSASTLKDAGDYFKRGTAEFWQEQIKSDPNKVALMLKNYDEDYRRTRANLQNQVQAGNTGILSRVFGSNKSAVQAEIAQKQLNQLEANHRETLAIRDALSKQVTAHLKQETSHATRRAQVEVDTTTSPGDPPGRSRQSHVTPYSPIDSKLSLEAAEQARKQALEDVQRQNRLLGFALESSLKTYTSTLEPLVREQAAKKADEYRKQANDIRRKLANGLSASDTVKAQADLALLEQRIRDLSDVGGVDLGVAIQKTTTTLKDAAGALSAQATQNGEVFGRMFNGNFSVSSPFGPRTHPRTGQRHFHQGTDFRTPVGTPLLAPFSGTVVDNRYQARRGANGKLIGWGNLITIQDETGVQYQANHLRELSHLKVGQRVNQGDVIGYSGNSGGSTGPHLDAIVRDAAGKLLDVTQVLGKSLNQIAGSSSGAGVSSTEFTETQITAANTVRGAELSRMLAEAQNSADKEVATQANRLALATTVKEEEHRLQLQMEQLENLRSMGALETEQYVAVKMMLETERLKFEQQKQITIAKSQDVYTEQELQKYMELTTAELDRQLEKLQQQEELRQKSLSWRTGVQGSLSRITGEATNYAKFAGSQIDSVVGHLTTAFENLATTGKLNFRELTVSILNGLAKIYMQMAMMQLVSAVGGWFTGGSAAYGNFYSSGSPNFTTWMGSMGTSSGLTLTASRGAAFTGGGHLTAFASGGVVSSPTYFNYAGGRGLMGEQGAEAIVPLSRMANGNLGVSMQGLGGGTIVNAPITVNMVVNQDGSSETEVSSATANKIAERFRGMIDEGIVQALREDGLIDTAIRGRQS